MGNSVIWWTPQGSDRQVRIDLGRKLHDRVGPIYVYRQAGSESIGGAQSLVLFGGRSRLTLRLTWIRDGGAGDTLRRNLAALISHLQRGGSCTLAEDVTYAYTAFFSTPPAQDGQVLMGLESNMFEVLQAGVSVANREVVVQSDHDRYLIEPKLATAHVGSLVTLSSAIRTDFTAERWVCLREWGSWPALRMPIESRESGEYLTHVHESRYVLDLPLEEDPLGMDQLAASSTPLSGDSPWPGPVLDPWDTGVGGGPSRGWW